MGIHTGIDTIRVSRIQKLYSRQGHRALERLFTPEEIERCQEKKEGMLDSLAARFAAKEAVSKALGTGIWRCGVRFTDIVISSDIRGRPQVHLNNAARIIFEEMGGKDISISITHDGDLAMAICTIEYDTLASIKDEDNEAIY